jgi:hypothetical protein
MLLLLSVGLYSCSSYLLSSNKDSVNTRNPAEETNFPVSADELFTFKATSNITTEDNVKKKLVENINGYFLDGFKADFIVDPNLDSSIAFKLKPIIKNQKFALQVIHSPQGISDEGAANELIKFLKQLIYPKDDSSKVVSKYAIFEIFYNINNNDFSSLHTLAKLRAMSDKENPYWIEVLGKFSSAERPYNKKVKSLEATRKSRMDIMDKLPESKQFRSLVAKNDRNAVAELIRAYLPWEQMPPFERQFWNNYLNVMIAPLPIEERILIYRGVDDDIIQLAQDGDRILSKEEALKTQKNFLMSTILTKNQGSWNRRLRSLTSMYEKYIANNATDPKDNSKASSEFTKSSRISTMFFKHSQEPSGSPFLSYTPKIETAQKFGETRLTAYLIDPRMLHFNYASTFSGEVEFLLPLITFPDDLVALWQANPNEDSSRSFNLEAQKKIFDELAIEKLNREYGNMKGEEVLTKIKKNSEIFYSSVIDMKYASLQKVVDTEVPPNVFKATLGQPTHKVSQEITKKDSNIKCMDIIQMFWK